MTPEQRAREFCQGAFAPFKVPSLEPYVAILTELIAGAENDVLEEAAMAAEIALSKTAASDIRAMKHGMTIDDVPCCGSENRY